jgi:hypothetical protein
MASRSSPRRSRPAQLLSTILFVAAFGFAAAALWVWYNDDSSSGPGTPPPAQSVDDIDLAHVLEVLDARDSAWDYGRDPATARSNQLEMPGQALTRGDDVLFVFIFTGASGTEKVAARAAASEQIDLQSMTLATPSGTVINADGEPLWMAEHSNVITILVGGDQALADEVADALTDLP